MRWTTQDGGSLGDPTTVADDNGIASNDWTLGDAVGDQTAEASIEGAEGSPITFTAHAILGGGGGGGETAIVAVSGPPNNKFSPATITINIGETVTWRWATGAVGHNVTPDNGTIPAGEANLFSAPTTTATPSPRRGPTPTTARRTARRCPAPWWSSRRPDR